MGFLSWIGKGLNTFFTPESFKTGEKFENYVRKKIFTDRYFELIQRTYGYNEKKTSMSHLPILISNFVTAGHQKLSMPK